MSKKILFRKKAVLTSISIVFVMLSASIIVPAAFKPDTITVDNNQINFNEKTKDQLEYIFAYMNKNFEKDYYNSVMKSLCKLQRKYMQTDTDNPYIFDINSFIEYVGSQDIKTRENVDSMISDLYNCLQSQNLKTTNTDEYNEFMQKYTLVYALQRHQTYSNWFNNTFIPIVGISVLIVGVMWIFAMGDPNVFLTPVMVISMGAVFVDAFYLYKVTQLTWWLSYHGGEMIFYICNNQTGLPINNLTVTAEPFDNGLPEFRFTASQHNSYSKNPDGLYYIPEDKHVPGTDIPPGYYLFTVTGRGSDGQNYSYSWDNSQNPFHLNFKYSTTVRLDPKP